MVANFAARFSLFVNAAVRHQGSGQLRAGQGRAGENGAGQARAREIGSGQIGARKVGAKKVRLGEFWRL